MTLVVPGIGMKSSPCAMIQASATCPGDASYFLPMVSSSLMRLRIRGKFSALYLGVVERKGSVKSAWDFCEWPLAPAIHRTYSKLY